jgi:Bacterial Ig-like domain (group 3)
MPTLTHRPRAPRRVAAAAAGALLAAGLIVVAAAAVSRASGTGPPSRSATATATTLASAVSSSPVDGPVAYTATVRPAPGGGTVTFTDHAVPVPGCAAQPVSGPGTATCQAAYPSPGRHQVTAAYCGDTSYAASTSAPLTRQVTYRVQQLHVPAGPGPAGAITAVTVELLDATGADVSGPGIPLTVTGLWPRPAPGVAPVGPFTPVNVGLRPGYQLDVDTARYPPGTYTLTLTAGTDPLPHTAVFTVP